MPTLLPLVPLALALASFPPLPEVPSPYARLAGGGELGVCAVHVETGRTESFHGAARFPMASTVKLPLAIAALRAVDAGTLDEGMRVEIGPAELRHGMGHPLGTGTYTLRELLAAMLQESDNTATDAVFRLVGGPVAVRAALTQLGVSGIDVSRTELQIHGDWSGVIVPADGKVSPARLDRLEKRVPASRAAKAHRLFRADTRDTASPEAMAALLVKLQKGELLPRARTDELIVLMRGCRTGERRIRAGLPKGTDVAHKTGTMDDLASDVALVTLPDGTHVALAVSVRGGAADREKTIAAAARETWELFARK